MIFEMEDVKNLIIHAIMHAYGVWNEEKSRLNY